MKLIKCYVENFGILQQFEANFQDDFNEIIKDNGFGKTTLAVFIKAMFYGLPATKKTKINENERQKYKPWQGGNYGGYIDFQVGTDLFRIERFFGAKENEDIFKLIDLKTNKVSDKYTSNIGVELFDLDADAYERCTYIPQKEIMNGITDKLSSKLIAMIHGTENTESLEKTKQILDNRRQELKKKGNAGEIAEINAEIQDVLEKIDVLKRSASAINTLHIEELKENQVIEELELSKSQISNQIKEYGEIQKVVANKKYIEENKTLINSLEQQINEYKKVFNGAEVKDEELKEYTTKDRELSRLYHKIQTLQEDNSLARKQEELNSYFKEKVPTEFEINDKIQRSETLNKLKNEVENLKNQQVLVSQTQVKSNSKSKSKWLILPLLLSIVLTVAGGLFMSSNLIVSIISFIVAFLTLIVTGFLYFKNYIEQKTTNQPILQTSVNNEIISSKERQIAEIENELNEFLSLFNINSTQNKTLALYEVLSKRKDKDLICKQVELNTEKRNSLLAQCDELNEDVGQYLSKFQLDIEQSYEENLTVLKSIKDNYDKAVKNLADTKAKLKEFESVQNDEWQEVDVKEVDIDELQSQEKNLQNDINVHRANLAHLINKIDNIKTELASLDEFENKLVELKEIKQQLTQEYKVIELAKTFLTQANDNLSSKYLSPMKNGLNKYLKIVLGEKYSEYNIDTNLKVSFEEYGQLRELDFLSKGYQGVVDLCIRFALIDTLFTKEKPFIVLDDPFVNMDKQKLENAISLIKEASKEYQVVYLVCHEARC